MEDADAALARAIVAGHRNAPRVAWDRYAVLVRGVLRRVLGPGAEVDDQAQLVFLQLFRDARNLRDVTALRSFLIGITVRVARSELRRRRIRRWLHLTDDGVMPEALDEGADVGAREALGRLHALLNQLDDGDRLLFVLRHVEKLELTETAEAVGTSLATAKRRLAKVTARVHAMALRDPLLVDYLDPEPEPEEEEDDHVRARDES